MAQFYSAYQGDVEDVATWGCCLEHLLPKVTEHHPIKAHSLWISVHLRTQEVI